MKNNQSLKFTILSMSMITVMASATIAPALASIQEYFTNADNSLIKMTLTIPSLMVVIINFIFPLFSKKLSVRNLSLIGLLFYTFGGAIGGFVNNIYLLLTTRILLGIGVGFIMPLSTGLLAYYFDRSEQKKLMGYSVMMNNVGGIIAISLAGFLAAINWRYSFYVYFLGIIVILAIILYIPNEKIKTSEQKIDIHLIKIEWFPLISGFLIMIAFYTYITHFSIQAINEHIITPNNVGFMMSVQSFAALIISLCFGFIAKKIGTGVKYLGLILFVLAFILLLCFSTKLIYIIALFFIGSGMGLFIPYINSESVEKVKPELAPSIMALMTVTIYLGQFLAPPMSNLIMKILNTEYIRFPYIVAIFSILIIFILTIFDKKKSV